MGHSGREGTGNYHFNNGEMDSMYSLFSCLLEEKKQALWQKLTCVLFVCSYVCVCACACECFLFMCTHMHVSSSSVLQIQKHTFTDTPIITTWDWLFDCFQGVSAKSLFCDYRLIICPAKRLSSTIPRFRCLGLSGGWAFDWQLVNDVISILLGKWSSGNSRLVSEGLRQFVTADALSVMDGGATPARRNCPTVLFEERLRGRRVRMK